MIGIHLLPLERPQQYSGSCSDTKQRHGYVWTGGWRLAKVNRLLEGVERKSSGLLW